MSGLVLGVDPGAKGALVLLYGDRIDAIEDMPDLPPLGLGSWIAELLEDDLPDLAVVESQVGMPGQSSSATAKFHAHYGAILGTLSALHIRTELVAPSRWKRDAGLTRDKNASRALAAATWPEWASSFARVRDDGRAEAALIARHGRATS